MKSSAHRLWWRTAALLTLISLMLAACGGTSNQQPSSSTGATSAAAVQPTAEAPSGAAPTTAASGGTAPTTAASGGTAPTTAAPAAGGTTGTTGQGPKLNADVSGTIDFWHFWGSPVRRNAIRRVIAICQQQLPNIKVNETFKPFGDIWTANTAAVAAGSGMPDVIVEDRPKLPQAAQNNIEQSLQTFAQRDGIDGSQFWPFTWQQTLYNNETYGIPYETDVRVLYWNKNAFKEVGLDPEKPPTTWDELMQYADKLDKKSADGKYERIGFFPLIGNASPEVWGYTNGVEWITKDGKPTIDTPQAAETLTWIKQWVDRYGGWQAIQDFRAGFAAPPNDAFMSGKVAMYVDINGYASTLNFFRPQVKDAEGKNVNLDWAASDLPYKKAKASWSGGFALSIPKGAKNVDAAWEFIKCATGPDAQASWARDTYAMPANQAAAKDPVLLADPTWQRFVDAMGYTTGGNYLDKYPNWGEQLDQRYEQVWKGTLAPADALKQAQDAVAAEVGQ